MKSFEKSEKILKLLNSQITNYFLKNQKQHSRSRFKTYK